MSILLWPLVAFQLPPTLLRDLIIAFYPLQGSTLTNCSSIRCTVDVFFRYFFDSLSSPTKFKKDMSTKPNNGTVQKEQERNELHRAIWQIANDLRGSVDGWDFKQYVLGMLFYRFISENLTSYINKEIARIVARQQELRAAIDKIVADIEGEA